MALGQRRPPHGGGVHKPQNIRYIRYYYKYIVVYRGLTVADAGLASAAVRYIRDSSASAASARHGDDNLARSTSGMWRVVARLEAGV